MSIWIFWGLYAAGFLFTYRRGYVLMSSTEALNPTDTFERTMAAVLAMLCSTMWPLFIIGYGIWWCATPVTPAQRAAELDERQDRIERMERELGIERG
jgi:uncharacterized iron-regulated membrane protein